MNIRELALKTISNELANWQVRIENLNSLNLYDANLFSETSICDLLNEIFEYELKNVNSITKNHPSIDLADNFNQIGVQVTSTKTKSKIQTTLDKFFENNLDKKLDKILIIILGNKQKSYSNIKVKEEFNFNKDEHIIYFKDILSMVNKLSTKRIERIASLLVQENKTDLNKKTLSNSIKVKRNLALKKRMKIDLLKELTKEELKQALYIPSKKFVYKNVIIRSVDDKNWPDFEEVENETISGWFKGEFWNFYENGIELISIGYFAIFDKNGNWDLLDREKDERGNNPIYNKIYYSEFLRIPYENIVDYDMEPDDYYGVPTIYVEYAKEGMPYEEILYGTIGKYDNIEEYKSELTFNFEKYKRKKLQ